MSWRRCPPSSTACLLLEFVDEARKSKLRIYIKCQRDGENWETLQNIYGYHDALDTFHESKWFEHNQWKCQFCRHTIEVKLERQIHSWIVWSHVSKQFQSFDYGTRFLIVGLDCSSLFIKNLFETVSSILKPLNHKLIYDLCLITFMKYTLSSCSIQSN